MRTLNIRHISDEVAARPEKLTESARRADNAELLNALPSLPSSAPASWKPWPKAAPSTDRGDRCPPRQGTLDRLRVYPR
jgi:hypothetical protein